MDHVLGGITEPHLGFPGDAQHPVPDELGGRNAMVLDCGPDLFPLGIGEPDAPGSVVDNYRQTHAPRYRSPISQAIEPVSDQISTMSGGIVNDFEHGKTVSYCLYPSRIEMC